MLHRPFIILRPAPTEVTVLTRDRNRQVAPSEGGLDYRHLFWEPNAIWTVFALLPPVGRAVAAAVGQEEGGLWVGRALPQDLRPLNLHVLQCAVDRADMHPVAAMGLPCAATSKQQEQHNGQDHGLGAGPAGSPGGHTHGQGPGLWHATEKK